MVGQALSRGRYRYYRCRRSYAGYFEGRCDSRYVRVEALEHVVLSEVAKLLADPARILDEASRLSGQGTHDTNRDEVRREIRRVEEQQRRLARLYVSGSVPEDVLAAESDKLNRLRSSLEAERRNLAAAAHNSVDLNQLGGKLSEVSKRLAEWVLSAKDGDVRLILQALDLQIKASREQVHIEGAVPVLKSNTEDLVTIVQTSA